MLSLVADYRQNNALVLNPKFVEGFRAIIRDPSLDKVMV